MAGNQAQMQVLAQTQEVLRQYNLTVVNNQMDAANKVAMETQQANFLNNSPPNDPNLSAALDDAKVQGAAVESANVQSASPSNG